jgi:hypothetical protein
MRKIWFLNHTQSVQELIDFVFPPTVVADPTICISRAILSPFNAFVNAFNASILHNVPGPIHRYHSSDSVEGDAENSSETVLADTEFLNSLEEPGIPPHELVLKIGAICRLTRNFDASCGLTKNTRVIVRNLFWYTVEVETISSIVAGRMVDPVRGARFIIYTNLRGGHADMPSHSSNPISLSTSRIQFCRPSKANPASSLLCYFFQWMPGFNCSKTRPRPPQASVLAWTTLLCYDACTRRGQRLDFKI